MPVTQTPFATLNLAPELLANLDSLGYTAMTPVQAASLPLILAGRDVIAQAKTGSGKTAAFGLGLLARLDVQRFRVQVLVLCPTRELADQVAKEIRKLARTIHNIKVLTLCGGMPFGPQLGSLEHGAHIIVGTPGRVEEHLRKGSLVLDNLTTLVLDEADRMLEMGFAPALDAIVDKAPKQRQTLLFSATFPDQIQRIAKRILQQPETVKVESTHDAGSIVQHFYNVGSDDQRLQAVRLLLLQFAPESAVVFCNTKKETQDIADALRQSGFSVAALHGDLEQRERDEVLVRFANKSVCVLVATDVAARGLDIDSIEAVINYQLAHDADVHVHRIGRSGRAGNKGFACSLFTDRDHYKVALIQDYLGQIISAEPLPPRSVLNKAPAEPSMATLQIDGGKKQKIRPGDILGALTGDNGIAGNQVGKIQVFDNCAYVAVQRSAVKAALTKLGDGKLKGRAVRVRLIRG